MNRVFVLFLFSFLLVSCSKGPSSREGSYPLKINNGSIVGGDKVPQGQFSQVIALEENGESFCSGAFVRPGIILSAAHCFVNPEDFEKDKDSGRYEEFNKILKSLPFQESCSSVTKCRAMMRGWEKEKKRKYVENLVNLMFSEKRKKVKVYWGEGAASGKVQGQMPLTQLRIPKEWVEASIYYIYKIFKIHNEQEDDFVQEMDVNYENAYDWAILHLPKALWNSSFVTPFRGYELDSAYFEEGQHVKLVGYGFQNDPDLHPDLSHDFGIKMYVDVGFKEMFETDSKKLAVVGLKDKVGACGGDSGGPAFIYTKRYGLKILGNIVATDEVCGKLSDFSSNDDEIEGTTIVKVFEEESLFQYEGMKIY